MTKLALFGGTPEVGTLAPYNSIGAEELAAASNVLKDGVLSKFLGCWDPDFYGGPRVQEFERVWREFFKSKFAVTVNSNTSGLIAAIGAVGVEPGDEVIVSPWTMSASATSILVWNGIPVFADIETDTFNLDPVSIEKNITPHTRAIMVTDIFGHAARLDEIMAIARKHNLKVIEDAAQAPGAMYHNRFVGTIADIGVYSLNYHKHIHTGEGGVCVTDDGNLAERLQLIRNHAESVVADKGVQNIANMIGFNFRMTEIEAAIGIEQLKKLNGLVASRIALAKILDDELRNLPGLKTPFTAEDCSHVYYVYPLLYDKEKTGVNRNVVLEALLAEGVPIAGGYLNLHLLPMYQKQIAHGTKGFPWKPLARREVSYAKGICPQAERLHNETFMQIGLCSFDYAEADLRAIGRAFRKVWENLDALKSARTASVAGK